MYKRVAYLIKNNYNFEINAFFKNINDYKQCKVDYDMNPVSWTKQKRGFYMSKLSYKDL